LLKKPKTDIEADDGPPPRRLLIAGGDEAACEVYAGVLATYGFETASTALPNVVTELRDTLYGCAVLVGTDGAESSAMKQLDAIRQSDHTHVRRTAVVLLTSSKSRQMFAWETGIDGFIVMPAEAADIVAAIEDVLARPRLERYNHRQAMLQQARKE
jgi:DNA-binding NtrC family response regulator